MFSKASNNIKEEDLYSPEIIDCIVNYTEDIINEKVNISIALLEEIQRLCYTDKEKFYISFYSNIMSQQWIYFEMDSKAATILLKKLGEFLYSFIAINSPENGESTTIPKSISEKELNGLQYLGKNYMQKFFERNFCGWKYFGNWFCGPPCI